jgi:hypothetical protein
MGSDAEKARPGIPEIVARCPKSVAQKFPVMIRKDPKTVRRRSRNA